MAPLVCIIIIVILCCTDLKNTGTGKTMLVKAVAHHTTAAFIRVVGSEFVQKYLGEGPRMVRDVFRLARENSPAIIFIDEIDAIATKRFDAQTGADREVQRILLELLNQMDGFDQGSNVKICLHIFIDSGIIKLLTRLIHLTLLSSVLVDWTNRLTSLYHHEEKNV